MCIPQAGFGRSIWHEKSLRQIVKYIIEQHHVSRVLRSRRMLLQNPAQTLLQISQRPLRHTKHGKEVGRTVRISSIHFDLRWCPNVSENALVYQCFVTQGVSPATC